MKAKDKIKQVESIIEGHNTIAIDPDDDVYKIQEFVDHCNNGNFIDYDGSGYYGTSTWYCRDMPAFPSEIIKGNIEPWTHVVWFNR